ncbi:ubiquitin C-terminal hydrolase 12 [Capsicum galapagoense]
MREVNKENSTDASPARYLMKIESFSSLSENGFLKYESNEFESCGYKWKMIIHPVGDGEGHISLYLAIVGTSSLHADWEVNASFSFLILDQIHDNYIVMKHVYVIKNQGIGECLLSLNGVKPYKHEWKINEFTKLKSYVYSEEFAVYS